LFRAILEGDHRSRASVADSTKCSLVMLGDDGRTDFHPRIMGQSGDKWVGAPVSDPHSGTRVGGVNGRGHRGCGNLAAVNWPSMSMIAASLDASRPRAKVALVAAISSRWISRRSCTQEDKIARVATGWVPILIGVQCPAFSPPLIWPSKALRRLSRSTWVSALLIGLACGVLAYAIYSPRSHRGLRGNGDPQNKSVKSAVSALPLVFSCALPELLANGANDCGQRGRRPLAAIVPASEFAASQAIGLYPDWVLVTGLRGFPLVVPVRSQADPHG